MNKRPGVGNGRVQVIFEVDPAVRAERANLCGEFNSWSRDSHPMERKSDGGFSLEIELEAGRAYRFRYLLDGERWENDWAADDYVPNEYFGDDSLVDLTRIDGGAPPVKRAGGTKKAAPAKAAAKAAAPGRADGGAKKAAPVKKAADKGPAKKAPAKKKAGPGA